MTWHLSRIIRGNHEKVVNLIKWPYIAVKYCINMPRRSFFAKTLTLKMKKNQVMFSDLLQNAIILKNCTQLWIKF